MATLHGTAKRAVELSAAKGKGKEKIKESDMDIDEVVDESQPPKKKRNKQRVLMLSSRGVTHRMRHLMNDLEALLPHVKKGARHSRYPAFGWGRLLVIDMLLLPRCKIRLEKSLASPP